MSPKFYKIVFVTGLLCFSIAVYAQEDNPFESIGKKGKVLTASNGKFVETFDYDSIQRVGSVLININSKKIVKLLNPILVYRKFSDNTIPSRWYRVDPLADQQVQWSPYHFGFDNPIRYNDPTGMVPGDFYNTSGEKIGTDGKDDKKVYLVYKHSDVKTIENNTKSGNNTQVGDLKDPLQLPTEGVRQDMKAMVDRSNSPNDKRTDEFKGDDTQGKFHEEGGYFTMDKIIDAKPGPMVMPDAGNGSVNPFDKANPSDNGIGQAFGTVHVHPAGQNGGSEFVQTPSRATTYGQQDDYSALGSAQKMGWVNPAGYSIVIGAQQNQVTFYNASNDKVTIPMSVFLSIGK